MRYAHDEHDHFTNSRRGPGRGRGSDGRGGGPGRGPGRGRRGPGDRRNRARRGDVRAAALALLAERPMHGYEMIQELDHRTGGVWKPSPGSVYPALALLEDEGLVRAESIDGKRRFSLTDDGRAAVDAAASGTAPWDRVAAGVSSEDQSLRRVSRQVAIAARQVAEAGDDAAKARAVEILTDVRRQLYAILAEAG